MRALLWGKVVEAKLHALDRAIKANFDPNQPRVPAGNPDGGQWTSTGGGSGSQSANERLAQARGGRRRGSDAEATPAQLARRDIAEAQARAAIRRVNDIDPAWKPRASLTRPNSVEGEIARAEAARSEAEVRLRELAQEEPTSLIDAFRRQHGLDLLGDPIWSREQNSVSTCQVDGVPYLGVNSQAITYTNSDRTSAERARSVLIEKHPDVINTDDIGQFPNDALFHAEATCLLRAARANGGTLETRVIEVTVDRVMCPSCRTVLPVLGLELGNPTVRFIDPRGFTRTMRDGHWIE
ncbi:hypothetical protein [Methyloceanibacter sp.]|uniref:hypothetical protein n=1 Tax=Methyloceanibacter sp. TaxID=1965321 RepID=UPI003D6CDEF8